MTEKRSDEVRRSVREAYAAVADADDPSAMSCCAPTDRPVAVSARRLGYSEAEIEAAPEGANMGLGCGNPTAIASLKAGETVLDLGSGGGFDSFLAATKVGPQGHVIGVDMTADAEVADSAFHLGMSEQQLDRPWIAGLAIDQGCLGAPQGVRAIR